MTVRLNMTKKHDFKALNCHARSKRPLMTVRLNMTKKHNFKALICHSRSKRPAWTVRLNLTKKHDFKALICHAIVKMPVLTVRLIKIRIRIIIQLSVTLKLNSKVFPVRLNKTEKHEFKAFNCHAVHKYFIEL